MDHAARTHVTLKADPTYPAASVAAVGTRRTYGTGSLYIKDGHWYGRWRSGDGARRARKLGPTGRGGLGRKQAEERLRQAMLADVAIARVGTPSLAELAPALIADLQRRDRKRSHVRTVRSRLDAHILPLLGALAPGELVADDVRRLIDHMQSRGASPKTIRNTVAVLHTLLRLAQERCMCERNVAEQVALPEPRRDRTLRYLTMPELERALAAAPPEGAPQIEHDWWRVIRLLALTGAMTGLRLGELRALRWRDLDMAALRVRVHRAIVDGRVTTPKSRSSERSVPLASRLVAEFDQHHRQSPTTPTTTSCSPTPTRAEFWTTRGCADGGERRSSAPTCARSACTGSGTPSRRPSPPRARRR